MALQMLIGILAVGLVAAEFKPKYDNVLDLVRENSDSDLMPLMSNSSSPLSVSLELSVKNVVEIDESFDKIHLVLRHTFRWNNPLLAWDKSDPRMKVENILIPIRYIWIPDIFLTETVSTPEWLTPQNAQVSYNGDVTCEHISRVILQNDLSGLKTPAGAIVSLKYQSWSNDNSLLQIKLPQPGFSTSEFQSKRFQISNPTALKQQFSFSTSPRVFDVINFSFNLKKL